MNSPDEYKPREDYSPSGITEILDRTQGHLILKWNASSGAERLREIGLPTLYCLVAIGFLTIFAIESYLHNQVWHALILLVFDALTLCGYFYLRVTGNRRATNTFLVILLGALCLFLLYTGGRGDTGHLWFYVFPIFALFVQRLWSGVLAIGLLFIVTAYLLLAPGTGLESGLYTQVFKERFLAVYIAVSVMSFLYAYLRASGELEMAGINDYLKQSAETDRLTGLPNRNRITDVFYQEVSRFRRTDRSFSMVMMDVDHFKRVNDNHGHVCGDNILIAISTTFRSSLRTQDICARWGGEEFMLVLPDTDLEGARVIAERIRDRIQDTAIMCDDDRVSVTVSMGVYEYHSGDDLTECIKSVDAKLYEAKAAGRNRVVA